MICIAYTQNLNGCKSINFDFRVYKNHDLYIKITLKYNKPT